MIYEITTASGSKYLISTSDDGEYRAWMKVNQFPKRWHALASLTIVVDAKLVPADMPKIGHSMYITGEDGVWWLSTPIVSIEEKKEGLFS